MQWNEDVVTRLPDDAVLLAETPRGEVQVARFGPAMWGVQHHPEVDAAIVATWVSDSERAELSDRGVDADGLIEEIRGRPGRARPRLGARSRPASRTSCSGRCGRAPA